MTAKRSRAMTALTLATTMAVGLVPATWTLSGDPGESRVVAVADLPPGPTLSLETNDTAPDVVRRYDASGRPVGAEQALVGDKRCQLVTDNSLLQVTGVVGSSTVNQASMAVDSIGVAEKTSGTSCSQVGADTAERLVLRLNPALREGVFAIQARAARLDVELKQSARILATASIGGPVGSGGTRVWTFDLQSGASIGSSRPVDVAADRYSLNDTCLTAADSGPDSRAGDNCMWSLVPSAGVLFDTLELVPLTGSFSLEGGGDWQDPANRRSVLSLVPITDGDLCVGDSQTRTGTASSPNVTVTRIDNADGSTGRCLPYRFTNGPQQAELLKPLTDQPAAQFIFDLTWTVASDTTAGDSVDAGLVRRTTVDFDGAGTADAPTVIASCPDLTTTTIGGVSYPVVAGIAGNANAPDLAIGYPGTGAADTKQFACIVSQHIDPVPGTTSVTVSERIYAFGDIVLRKP